MLKTSYLRYHYSFLFSYPPSVFRCHWPAAILHSLPTFPVLSSLLLKIRLTYHCKQDKEVPLFCNKEGGCGSILVYAFWCATLISASSFALSHSSPLLISPSSSFSLPSLTFISDACFWYIVWFNTNNCVLPACSLRTPCVRRTRVVSRDTDPCAPPIAARVTVHRGVHVRMVHVWLIHLLTLLGGCGYDTISLCSLIFWFFTNGCLGTTLSVTVYSGA